MSALHVRRERAVAPGRARILFASDLHLGLPWTRRAAAELVTAVEDAAPDVVLVGGDLVDNPRGMDGAEACLRHLAGRFPVGVTPGNHDLAAGGDELRRRALRAGASWLPDGALALVVQGTAVCVSGPRAEPVAEGAVGVACLHHPEAAEAASRAGCVAGFAGHLHGGQCVLFERNDRLYPGAWFNRWTGLRFRVGPLRLFVSRGMGDTLPLRFNCPREVIVCDLGREPSNPKDARTFSAAVYGRGGEGARHETSSFECDPAGRGCGGDDVPRRPGPGHAPGARRPG